MDVSCSFATSLQTPEHIVLAEQLGYKRAWCYDSPALYPDVWMTLALAAKRTSRIGLGPGVLVPSLRHVMTNAAAVATLEALAPGRVAIAVGSGFTGRVALGQRPLPWSRVREYISALRALLRGEEVEWQGSMIRMLHREGFGPARPIAVRILVAGEGPRGIAVARDVGDGLLSRSAGAGFAWAARTIHGTVLEDGEAPGSPRAIAAAGHFAALLFHSAFERGQIATLPGGSAWAEQLEALPGRTRHLAIHEGHLIGVNALDTPFVTGELLSRLGIAVSSEAQRLRLEEFATAGVTEAIYQPAGPDIPRELRAFAEAAGL